MLAESVSKKAQVRSETKSILITESISWWDEQARLAAEFLKRLIQKLDQINPFLNNSFILGGFVPLKDEIPWNEHLTLESSFSIEWAFPNTLENSEMVFQQCQWSELEHKEAFGISLPVPPSSAPIVSPDILIIPGIAFSKSGKRLGRGKGFYDKYLENYNGIKI
ncbi:MAG: 5-formyltetrahydrofolate cyclo-ligase, partial [Bacteriovoracia bacterium]